MADDEAEQERLSGGGCAAELRRLGERLQELERRLCESREPAVEAAAAYCRQLCQVSPSPSAGPERPERGRSAPLCSAAGAGPGWPRARCTFPGLRRGLRGWAVAREFPAPGRCARSSGLCCWVRLSDRKVFVDVPEPIPPDLQAGSGGARPLVLAALRGARELSPVPESVVPWGRLFQCRFLLYVPEE